MIKKPQHAMALLMSFVLAIGMTIPVAAASHHVNVTYADGDIQVFANTNPILIHTIGVMDIGSIEVTAEGSTEALTHTQLPVSGSLPGGTQYQIYASTAKDGAREVYFKYTTDLKETIHLKVNGCAAAYTVCANSGVYGQGANRGGSATCMLSGNNEITLPDAEGSYRYSMTFTPLPGQEIAYFNLRANFTDDQSTQIVDASTKRVTVDGQEIRMEKDASGKVTISASTVIRDLFITALTKDETAKVTLNVATDSHVTADCESRIIEAGTAAAVTLTPDTGYGIGNISITSGGITGTIGPETNSVTINGKTYRLTRSLSGKAELSVPAMTDGVSILAESITGYHYLLVEEGRSTNSEQDGLHYLADTSRFRVTFTANERSAIEGLYIKTAVGVFHADIYDARIYVENAAYRLTASNHNEISVLVDVIDRNMEIYPEIRETAHSVSITMDQGVASNHRASVLVDDGENHSITFNPVEGCAVKTLKIRYDRTLYTVNAQEDAYVRIRGNSHPITVDASGAVTLTLYGIDADVSVQAISDYPANGTRYITRKADPHSSITLSGAATVAYGKSSTVTVTPNKGYVLASVAISSKTDSVTVYEHTGTFLFDGRSYRVTPVSDGGISICFDAIYRDLTVSSATAKKQITPVLTGDYHPAYLNGYGNRTFGPNYNMTRAEAVTMLVNLYIDDLKPNQKVYFSDVKAGAWYYQNIQNAASQGYLVALTDGSGMFYPNQSITRAELLALLFAFSKTTVPQSGEASSFSDMDIGHWATGYVNYARRIGWVNGYGDNTFHPDQRVARSEVVAMVNRVLGRKADRTQTFAVSFDDVPTTHWAFFEIMEATNAHFEIGSSASGEVWKH